jgi:tetratricopeptide (TPR) repeat protein
VRKLFADFDAKVREFLSQRDDLIMVVGCGPAEHVTLVKILDSIDQADSPDVFWIFGEPFVTAFEYVRAVVASFEQRYRLVQEVAIKAGEPMPEIPKEVLDDRHSPVERIRKMLSFARSLLADLDEQHLVAAFVPSSIADEGEFAELMLAVLEHDFPFPWCHHMRIVVSEDAGVPRLLEVGRKLARVRIYQPDLSPHALEHSLEDEANDAARPLAERMQALLVLAGMDVAHQRIQPAAEKYLLLARYFQGTGQPSMAAISLCGVGEALVRGGNLPQALDWFKRALTPALEAKSLQALVNIMLNLANLYFQSERWAEAFDHYGTTADLAQAAVNPTLKIQCHEQRGVCLHKLNLGERAWAEWEAGATLAKGMDHDDAHMRCLERLLALCQQFGLTDHKRQIEARIRDLQAMQRAAS